MTDISREKLEAWAKDNFFGTQVTADPNSYGQFIDIQDLQKALDSKELDADPWMPVSTPPENDDPVVAKEFYRYKRYKPNSQQFKRGIKARWQRHNGYGWDNSEPPAEWQIATEE